MLRQQSSDGRLDLSFENLPSALGRRGTIEVKQVRCGVTVGIAPNLKKIAPKLGLRHWSTTVAHLDVTMPERNAKFAKDEVAGSIELPLPDRWRPLKTLCVVD